MRHRPAAFAGRAKSGMEGVATTPRLAACEANPMRRYLVAALFGVVLAVSPAAAQAPAFLLLDLDSGMVLTHRDSDRLWYPASVTKLMTAYLTFDALRS